MARKTRLEKRCWGVEKKFKWWSERPGTLWEKGAVPGKGGSAGFAFSREFVLGKNSGLTYPRPGQDLSPCSRKGREWWILCSAGKTAPLQEGLAVRGGLDAFADNGPGFISSRILGLIWAFKEKCVWEKSGWAAGGSGEGRGGCWCCWRDARDFLGRWCWRRWVWGLGGPGRVSMGIQLDLQYLESR